jgi:anti-sigma-K factor RskA
VTIHEIIESGSLELYVMGSLPPHEMKEIDELRKTHPELNDEIKRIEDAMIAYADSHAIKPKEELKEKIAEKLEFSVNLDMQAEMVDSISIQIPGIYRYAAAAAIAVIIALGIGTFYFQHQYSAASNQLIALQNEKSVLANQVKYLTGESEKAKGELAVALKPGNRKLALLPVGNGMVPPETRAVVYWDTTSGATYVSIANLPVIPANKQYQLWAKLTNNQIVSLGVISKDSTFAAQKQVQNAMVFCITLEDLGGKPVPTEKMMIVWSGV